MSEKREDVFREGTAGQPLEDRALKSAARLFGEELMPMLGIREKYAGLRRRRKSA